MSDEIARLQELLKTGQRLSMQGSYERRVPDKKAVPYLMQSREGLLKLIGEQDAAEIWLLLALAEECLLNYPAARRCFEEYLARGGARSKKNLKRLANLKEHEKKWSSLMLTPEQLQGLGVFLERQLAKSSCDHTNLLTETWLKSHLKTKPALVLEALQKYGGYCDCEVLANVCQ
ncbi:MAG: DUF2695 domain-containing protein [Candidatus Obscuribacter phosphatis]|uniref:DUF2695 domain-containing protein n=1 Tax=Candidatus Obscuribacter phosphatis TaxID=1906157 RepID=A0A8J7PBV6_9BACT|nr:DUF2695 domain-containing protein [Candidatus Obscuribacter phosphatis]